MSAVAPLIGRYCGTKIPPEIQSSSGLLSLSFHTDMAVAKDGFSARYNMTHKEVTDCKCQGTFQTMHLCSVGLFVCLSLPPALSSPWTVLHHLCWHSSFFLHLSLLLDSQSFEPCCFNTISITLLLLLSAYFAHSNETMTPQKQTIFF